jgi:coiled-coil domain-containing protein 151
MIKYNEALSLKKTYETILSKLTDERATYEQQLTAIEHSLKNKSYDLQELIGVS